MDHPCLHSAWATPKLSRVLPRGLALILLTFCFYPNTARAITFSLDDGTAEAAVGIRVDADIIVMNSFPLLTTGTTIDAISVAFGKAGMAASIDGTAFRVVLWSDPNGDGNPSDATVLTTADSIVSGAGTNNFVSVSITPTTITTSKFFVGFLISQAEGTFPIALDQTPPDFPDRSFVTAAPLGSGNIFDLTANSIVPLTSIDTAGVSGNWLIRAHGFVVTAIVPEGGRTLLLFAIAIVIVVGEKWRRTVITRPRSVL